ncbi:uncharacterized protein LOC143251272 [Tachypleus tridentatus]|uniref:uncharacterized protein LOC143251272 n=1 Tax=Tachypleus tridentatus TaxID=6853 RepID=UPI003FD283F6
MTECKAVATPSNVNVKLQKDDGVSTQVDCNLYQSLVGSLLYAAMGTRPDIAVGAISKYCAQPNTAHLTAAKRILHYLKGTADLSLKFEKVRQETSLLVTQMQILLDDRKSTSGNTFIHAGAAVSWISKKQSTVALSTSMAEYIALSLAAQETVWLRRLLQEIGSEVDDPVRIMEDNQGTIDMVQNPVGHTRTKHIDIRYHFIR